MNFKLFIILSLVLVSNTQNTPVATTATANVSNGVNTNLYNIFGGLQFTSKNGDAIVAEAYKAWTANLSQGDACFQKENPVDGKACDNMIKSSNFSCCQMKTVDNKFNICLPTTSNLMKLLSDTSSNYVFACSSRFLSLSVMLTVILIFI